ncbi:MAG TPA: MarP family serine protease [Candidatus Limnocylindrales bacterium]
MIDSVNFVDLLALLIIGIAVWFGWRSGFVVQALALVGFIVGFGIVVLAAPATSGVLSDVDPFLRGVIVICAVCAIVLVAQAVGSAAGATLRRRMGRGVVGGVDTGAGAAFGFVRGLFLVWLMGGLAALLPMAGVANEARQSAIVSALESRLPSPVVIAAQLGRLMEATGLPDVFVGAPPADVPTGGPSQAEANQIGAAARASTLKVEAIACTNFVSGSSFAVSPNHFVTNAHVVAGSSDVWLSFDGSLDRFHASVVLFDPQLDIAMLETDRQLDVAPLTLSRTLPTRGENAVALGYTGGGGLQLIPALISRPIDALGRDIYGNQIIARTVIEMKSAVAPGDSGGPVILPDGSVGGVTFSDSRTQPDVGYALSPTEVAKDVNKAIDLGSAVDTGACLTES